MPRHMRFPNTCKECPIRCGRREMCEWGESEWGERFLWKVECPLIAVGKFGKFGLIDWESNGWPDITPFFGCEDTSNMPDEIYDYWLTCCDIAERQWERS